MWIRGLRTGVKHSEAMYPKRNRSGSRIQGELFILSWIRLPFGVAALILTVSCGPSGVLTPSSNSMVTPLTPMLVADLGLDIIVEDFDFALRQLDFVRELGGYVAAVDMDDYHGTERMTVELRVPHEHTECILDILRTDFGEVTYINALSADVSVRNDRLRRELKALEETLSNRMDTALPETRDRIELLRDMIAFQLERKAFLFVTVHLVESQ